ncbi:MAG TPA: hypothetical protein VLA92_01900, partial [Candidatus Saccharimonadales bacterium]|nr:hypothetical protein [Candidatus Saccharimonadales bacterium]
SAPVVEAYSLDGVDLADVGSMTRKQRAALRYRTVRDYSQQHQMMTQFTDYKEFIERRLDLALPATAPDSEIWSGSEEGAAAPDLATDCIETILIAANKPGAPEATEAELVAATHASRRTLLRIATHHFEEFGKPDNVILDATLQRNDAGKLVAVLHTAVPEKGSLDIYSAAALGCPALRDISDKRALMSLAEKAAYGSSNYIDHTVAAIINEAQKRGLFRSEEVPIEKPQSYDDFF